MIKQDYLIRMILEIITLIANALLNKQRIRPEHWVEYDGLTRQLLGIASEDLVNYPPDAIADRYEGDPNRMGKIELAAMTLLKISEETDADLVTKSRLRQNGLHLLKYVQAQGNTFSLQRVALIELLQNNELQA